MTDVDTAQDGSVAARTRAEIAAADAVVAAIDPGLNSPGVETRDVVLVAGPWLAGSTSVMAALRERMPQTVFVESSELMAGEAPAAVVFVVSAAAVITESDCALVDLASQYTDLVVGVVSKIDAHRDWRDVRDADAAILTERDARYQRMPWVGVAAAPDLGEPRLDDLVELLAGRLAAPDLARRNRLRAWETRLDAVIGRYEADGSGADRQARVDVLRERRAQLARARRLTRTERSIALRSQLQQARVQLGYFARNRCNSVRTELQEDVAGISRRRIETFEDYARQRADEVVAEVDEGVTAHLRGVAAELELPAPQSPAPARVPDLPSPPLKSRTPETRLMLVLGAGFGLGVAVAVSRLLAGAAPRLAVAGLVVGAVVGLLLAVWVVSTRGLLHDRAVLDRWIGEITATLRSRVEELVATRVLAAETALTSELAAREETEGTAAAEKTAAIDAELREHAVATARAAAQRDRRIPPLRRALDAVRAGLYGNSDATGE
ncbi:MULTISPECIES: hypothetical protein [unclassified Mycolicibacterium]|uniref:hypothetical protein n=1 Tax=unclassified Mycolicibacterium TaxID=2636767 RepID=UPI0012DEB3E1|nr:MULTISPECIES: hypothetical protein [unclassified Mycolicibacterium]MUL82710.1 hypothetical protein [Mycolicibacterium sp. CBMA 329]MUL89045.1 hypothetical protein [Mycolicibacterium sp. CBMA 331]MUL97612.1 hypothetical protein [Mycolicibacterium sp. CBMA 334]MUM26323.1 hypothetical protein [Mycolicibacterium sp. CBMA 295]MUM38561.1 hypothetical protein [Mycolicibacterium sp. CBMA 247]